MSPLKKSLTPSLDSKAAATRAQTMNAAEHLFAEHGLRGVSVREITQAADVNLAAINYHFGGKAGLIQAVLERGLIPLNTKRLAALEEAERAANPAPPNLEAILDAHLRPVMEAALDPKRGGITFLKFLGRCLSEQAPEVEKCILDCFKTLLPRFDQAWRLALPGLSMDEIYWRISFTHGAMDHWLLTIDKPVLGLLQAPGTWEEQLQRLIRFSAAGMRAGTIKGLQHE